MEYRTLGKTGLRVSSLGFGASSLGGVFRPIDESEGVRTVHASLDGGINFIDVSPFYGLTRAEQVLGRALGQISRDRYLLATKVGRYGYEMKDFDFSADRVTRSIDESLDRLGVDYLDLIQVHDMEFGDLDQVVNETLPALRRAQQAGKARFVGITGLPLKCFTYVIDRAEVDTILSYCHYLLNDTALEDLIPSFKQRNIGIISAAPLGMGLLSSGGPPAWHPAPGPVKQACAKAAELCASRGSSIEKLAIQFAVSNPDIATTVVGSADVQEMQRNIDWAAEPIDSALLGDVQAVLQPIHNVTWPSGRPENN